MDAYFSALYDNAKSLNSNLQVLTPSMAQGANAEKWLFGSCNLTALIVNGDPTASAGYDWMQPTYTTKNDGYSWHNYWRQQKEFWSSNLCPSTDTLPSSDHIFQYFPAWLQTEITSSSKPAFITEADLFSPCPPAQNNITNKDAQADTTQESIWRFFSEERGADFVIAWLLTESPHYPPACASPSGVTWPSEIAWHEAYREDGTERDWFRLWWLREE